MLTTKDIFKYTGFTEGAFQERYKLHLLDQLPKAMIYNEIVLKLALSKNFRNLNKKSVTT